MFRFLRRLFGQQEEAPDPDQAAFERFANVAPVAAAATPAAPPAPFVADRIAQLLDLNADPDTVAEAYAAFERAYPQAALPGAAQIRAAHLLRRTRRRLLAIEAYRKVIRYAHGGEADLAEAQLALAEILGESPSSGAEALRLLAQIRGNPAFSAFTPRATEAEARIKRILEGIHAPGPSGAAPWPPKGRCRILAQTLGKFCIPDVGKLLAARLGGTFMDLTAGLSRSPGLIARGLDPEQAESLAHELQAINLPVVVLPEENCPPVPPAELALEILLTDEGGFVVKTLDQTVEFVPAQIGHAQFGILRSVHTEPGESKAVLSEAGTLHYREPDRRRQEQHFLLDLYFFDPLRRIRLQEGRTPIGGILPRRPDVPQPTFLALAKRVLKDALQIPPNHTLDALFSDMNYDPVTFDSEQAFENRAAWLFWLAYNRAAGE